MDEFGTLDLRLRNWARAGASLVLAGGLVVLMAVALDLSSFREFTPDTAEIKPATAMTMILTATSTLLLIDIATAGWKRRTGRLLAVAVTAIGFAFLSQYVFGWDLGIDELPFRDLTGREEGADYPGRLAPATATSFSLTGLALMSLDVHLKGRWRLGELLALLVIVIASMSLIAYMYSIPSFYQPDPSTKMALTASVAFIVLGLSVIMMRPRGRLASIITTTAPGGVLARRLTPILIVIPLLLGWVRLEATDSGVFQDSMGTWWLTASTVAISLLVLWRVAAKLNEVDEDRKRAEKELYDLANQDGLTGLWNRRRFREELAGHAARSRRQGGHTAIISLSINGLRDLDARLGHAMGNAALEEVGERIIDCTRVSDVAGRLGGHEFAVLLIDSTASGARSVAEKLQQTIAGITIDSGDNLEAFRISAEVGIAQHDGPLIDDGHILLSQAIESMYESGGGGRRPIREATVTAPGPDDRRPPPQVTAPSPAASEAHRRANVLRRLPWLATIAAAVTLPLLVWDHFDRLGVVALVLTSLILTLALAFFIYYFQTAGRSRASFEEAERLRRESAASSRDCVVTIDTDGTILDFNPAAERTFGWPKNEAAGHDLAEFISPLGWHEWRRRGVAALTGGGSEPILDQVLELTAISERSGTFPIEMTLSLIRTDPPVYSALIRDISERRARDEEKERLAAIVRSSKDAIYSNDLNGVITAWNQGAEDLFGFTADEAIGRQISALTVPENRLEEVEMISERVLRGGSVAMTTKRHTRSGKMLDVSIRSFPIRDLRGEIVGVSISAHDLTEKRLREKEEARSTERTLWTRRIEQALENDRFVFFGQPVIDVASRTVHHHELLIRMDLDGEIVTPDNFLPHAEASDLIIDIDRWAIRRGIGYGARSPVAINLSGRSLSTVGLSGFIAEALQESGADPADIRFEITETAAASNLDDARRLVGELSELGCGSSLDDFGTGYGTFTYLKFLPVDELKIDVTFIKDLRIEVDRRVVESIISVAESFGMQTVAEGVEDEETLTLLEEMGVDLAQGYHIGRPAPMEQT